MASDRDRQIHLSIPIPDEVWNALEAVVADETERYLRSERFIEEARATVSAQMRVHINNVLHGYGTDKDHPLKRMLDESARKVLEEALTSLRKKE